MVNTKLHITIVSVSIDVNRIDIAMYAQEYSAEGGEIMI